MVNKGVGGHRGHDRMVVGFTTTYAIKQTNIAIKKSTG